MLLCSGIRACAEQKNTLSALVLLYSAIDTAGWLDSEQPYATSNSFTTWAEKYLLEAVALDCTAIDLYAARCGLLHTFTPESRLTVSRKARRICYAWGDASVEEVETIIHKKGKSRDYVAVHFDDLHEALRLGLLAFARDLDAVPERRNRVCSKATSFFHSMEKSVVHRALSFLSEDQDPACPPVQSST